VDNQEQISEQAKFVPLTAEQAQAAEDKVNQLSGSGT
jgi:hypothetical protein